MKTFKAFFFGIILLFSIQPLTAQSISVSGGGQWTLNAGETTHTFRFWISYNTGGLQTTSLHYKVDGGSQVPSNPVGDGGNNPSYVDIALSEGTHTIEFIWYGYDWGNLRWFIADTKTNSSTVKFNVYVSNIFGGGNVTIDGQTQSSGSAKTVVSGNSIGIGAIEQSYSNYNWVWNTSGSYLSKWVKRKYQGAQSDLSSSQSTSYSVATDDNATTLEAGLRKVCSATFQGPDQITVNGNSYNGSASVDVVEGNTATATASEYFVSSDWIAYSFNNWTWSGGSSTNRTITPIATSHTTYTANYTGTARQDPMDTHFTSSNGQYISLAWTDHPNTNVTQYQVWRTVTGGSTSAIATLNRGTTSYTDYNYTQNPNGATKLFYTVKAYYAPSGTWNDPAYLLNRGDFGIANIVNNNDQLNVLVKELPTEYSLGNYPNPFNPTTAITYQLPESGFVTIKVYDMLGKEVATLVNESKSAGYYKVNFDASKLTSGVYIYTINAGKYTQSKKMLLMK